MASTRAMFTGLTSLNAHSRSLEVIGNNIANVSTTAYKSSRVSFQTQFYDTLSLGAEPQGTFGGTNPDQVGTGVRIAGTQVNNSVGSLSPTGDPRDLAINGEGYFVVDRQGSRLFTRDGAFRTNLSDELVTINGDRLMGYGVDGSYNVLEGGSLQPLTVPIGRLTIAEATETSMLFGNLNAGGQVAQTGSVYDIRASETQGLRTLAGTPMPVGSVITQSTLLTNVADPEIAGNATPMFQVGETIEFSQGALGGSQLRDAQLEITGATTVQDLLTFLTNVLGIQDTGPNPDGQTPGVTIDEQFGVIRVVGNTGSLSEISIANENIRLLDSDGTISRLPFFPTQLNEADGEAVRTTMVVFDSLGTPVDVNVTLTLDATNENGGTRWRYDVLSGGDSDVSPAVATGTVQFDAFGQLVTPNSASVTVDRANTGAATPLGIEIQFAGDSGRLTALSDDPSEVRGLALDGLATGTLEAYSIAGDGTIVGSFSNSATRSLGRVAVATFVNEEGLAQESDNLFRAGPNSGDALVVTPGALSSGQIVAGALEQSNVDLGREFINMILTSTGYSAASRVIQTSDELLQQLLVLGR